MEPVLQNAEEGTSENGEEGTLLNDYENPFIRTWIATSYRSFRAKLRHNQDIKSL